MTVAGFPTCSLCGVEKQNLNGVTVCLYCDFNQCVNCGHPAPPNYLNRDGKPGPKCSNCGQRHPGLQ